MRHIAVVAAISTVLVAAPSRGAAQALVAGPPAQTIVGATVLKSAQGTINGVAVTPMGQPLGNMLARARNLLTRQIDGSAMTASSGHFSITGLTSGGYVVEIVDRAGQIVGTSAFISLAAAAPAIVTVTAATGTLTSVTTATGLAATLGATAAESVKYAAAAAGVAGVVAPADLIIASPSR